MSPVSLASLVDAARRAVRRDAVLATAAVVGGVGPLALMIAWLLGGTPAWSEPGPLPLLLVIGAVLVAVALGVVAVRLWVRTVDERLVATRAEETAGLPAGTLRGVLELGRAVPRGTSEALFRRAESDVAQSLAGRSAREVSGQLGRSTRRRLAAAAGGLAVLSLGVAVLAMASPRRTRASWAPLLHPVAHLTPPPLPALEVVPGNTTVARGEDVAIRVRAPSRQAVTLAWRSDGAVLERVTLSVVSDTTSGRVPRVDARTTYWVEAPDGARSAEFTISPIDPLLVSELVVEVVFPAYLERTPERYDAEVPALQIPEGTRLIVRGRATRSLREATLVPTPAGKSVSLTVDQDRFSTQWLPTESGIFDWRLVDNSGDALAAAPAPIDLSIVPDGVPEIELTYPLNDTTLAADLVQLVAADARDDHGLASATVVSWRVSRFGRADPPREDPIEVEPGDRSLLRAVLDARDRGMLPGDTLKVKLRVTDSSPRRQSAETRVLSLFVPGMSDMRQIVGQEAESLVREAAEMARNARQVEQATRDLQRRTAAANARDGQTQTGNAGGAGSRGSMDFQQSEQGRQVMEQQQALLEQIQAMRERLEAFERAAERAGLQDAGLRKEMEELRQLYDQLMTPEMRQRMEELRQSLENMDPKALEQALQKLGEQQDAMRKQLEKSLETLRQAAAEQEMNALAQEARELAAQQQALASSMRDRTPGSEQATQQRQLADRTQSLEAATENLKTQLERLGQQDAGQQAGKAADNAASAAERMRQAAQDAATRDGNQAAAQGEQAARQLENAASTLDGARQAMADQWKQELQEAVQQAMNEALSLAQRQQELQERLQRGQQESDQTGQQQAGQQQAGQQQAGQQQAGQQQAGQQQAGQLGQQQGGLQGLQQGGQQGQQQGQQQGGQQPGGQQQGGSGTGGTGQNLVAEQQALQQGLEQLGRNLAEAGDQSSLLDRNVGAALGRANLSMQQALSAMQQANRDASGQAGQAVDALNRLAMALLQRAQEIEQSNAGSALEQVLQQLADVAKQQGSLNGQSSALMPMQLAPRAVSERTGQLAQEQREIASQLDGLSNRVGKRDDLLGQLDQLAREAEAIAQTLDGGRLPPEVLARQERLFHRLLDAGRTLEKEEYSEERKGELPGAVPISRAPALDASLLNPADRFRIPTPEELRQLPPAYRRLVLEYFARLNRAPPPGDGGGTRR